MIEKASLIIGNDNFAVKEDKFLGYGLNQGYYFPREIDVVRATTATRVNEDGLIELVAYNLLTYSNTFANSAWVKNACTITANSIISPDGTQNASKLVESTANDSHHIYQNAVASGVNTFSFYAKAGERNFVYAYADSVGQGKCFDLQNGTVGANIIAAPSNATITSVGNGWYRCTITLTIGSASALRIGACSANGTFSYLGDGTSGIYIYGAQLNIGTSAKTYFPTTDRLDIARVDYTNGTKSLLVEPQRTNLALYSEQFDNAYWVKSESTTTANFATSPNGTMSADTIAVNSNNAVHRITNAIAVTNATTYTLSIYAKKNNFDFIFFRENIDGNFTNTFFNVSNGNLGSIGSGRTARIQNVGNGWYRCSITGTSALTSYSFGFGVSNTDGVISFLGNGTDYNLIWGAQLEAGSNATSYIPTVGSSVTRNADVISKTGISNLIGQTEGTIYAEIKMTKIETKGILEISADSGNFYRIRTNGSGNFLFRYRTASGTETTISALTFANTSTGVFKIAFAYKNGDYAAAVNGVVLTSSATGISPIGTFSQMDLGLSPSSLNDSCNSAILFKTRLTNEQLAQLTTI